MVLDSFGNRLKNTFKKIASLTIVDGVVAILDVKFKGLVPGVEDVQDIVEESSIEANYRT